MVFKMVERYVMKMAKVDILKIKILGAMKTQRTSCRVGRNDYIRG